jgi:exopolysaccharide biosynthesis polyprenyl glycosylphosphotransferase
VATKPVTDTRPAETAAPSPVATDPVEDIRSSRPYILKPSPLRAVARRAASIVSLVTLDMLGLTLGLYAALVLREAVHHDFPPLWGVLWRDAEAKWLPFLTLITILVFWRAHLYAAREFRAGLGRVISSLALVAVLTLAFGLGSGHHFDTFGLAPAALVFTATLIGLLRASYEVLTKDIFRIAGVRRRAVLVGEGESLEHLYRTLGEIRGGIAYEFVGAVATPQEGAPLPILGDLENLPTILGRNPVDELIVTDQAFTEEELLEVIEQAHRAGVQVRIAPKTTSLLTQRGEYVPGQGVPLFELRPPVFAGTDWAVKRAFDVVVSGLVIVLGSPVWLAIAAGIKLTSRGPILYRDRRIGLGEREFGMLKFRTMYEDAAARQEKLEPANEASGPLFKIRDDPRVTPIGRVLRRLSLDEVPQVLNVIVGEMSLVGPRPLPVRDYRLLEDWHRKRYLVLPGMTGLWQISGRATLSFDDLVRLDFYYLENWSIWLDISILAKTVPAVLASRGAF